MWSTLKPFQPSRTSFNVSASLERRSERALGKRSPADDHRRPLRILERVRGRLGQFADQREIVAEPFDLEAQIDLRPDAEHLRPAPHRLAQPRVDQRRFPARVGADQQDRIRRLDPGDGRIERHRGEVGDVIIEAGLAPFEQLRPLPFEQRLRRIHRLGVEQVAGDRRDLRAGRLHLRGEDRQRFVPGRLAQLSALAQPRPVEPVRGPAHRHGGASCRAPIPRSPRR